MASDPKELAARLREEKEFAIKDVDGDWLRLGKCHHPDAADMLEALAADRDAAWKAGAEAMREACVKAVSDHARESGFRACCGCGDGRHNAASCPDPVITIDEHVVVPLIRALPIPSREGGDV